MGDYYHMVSFNEGAHLAWVATFTGISKVSHETDDAITMRVFPNPVMDEALYEIKLKNNLHIKLSIIDLNGRIIKVITDKVLEKGLNKIQWKNNSKLESGIYLIVGEGTSGIIFSERFVLL